MKRMSSDFRAIANVNAHLTTNLTTTRPPSYTLPSTMINPMVSKFASQACRSRGLLGLVRRAPLPLAKFFTTEFYSTNITVGQRLEILQVFPCVIDVSASVRATPHEPCGT